MRRFVRCIGFRSLLVLSWLCTLPLLSLTGFAQAMDLNAPTSTLSPEEIDGIWQKASGKYDAARSRILERVDQTNAHGWFRPDWEWLQHYQVPEWYKDAKLGIFIHWGVYSVPAFGSEWYPRQMYSPGFARVPTPHRYLWAAGQVWIQGFHSAIQGGEV